MSYVQGEDRGQAALLPAAIEDYVAADAPVRVIDAFVDGLDVNGLGFGRSVPAATGRPPYDPRDLLKLYVYGYLNEVRSSRRLERECSRNVEVMWLLRRLAPDFKTIADFRRDNGTAIVGTSRAFVLFCRDQSLFTARLVALDGSKFRAAASTKRVTGRREIAEEAVRLDRRIAEYLAGLDESDAREPDEAPNATAAALQVLKSRRAELDRLAAKLDAEERTTLVEGELDARPMGIGKGPKPPSYNVQTAVDADTGLIVHHEVTSEVVVTRDGQEALDYLFCRGQFSTRSHENPAVILLDLKLPKVDGLEVLQQVKSDERLKMVPVVVLTSSHEEKDMMKSYKLGVNAYVVKPVDFHEFVNAVKELGAFWAVINEPPPGSMKKVL